MNAPIQVVLVDLDNLRHDRHGPLPAPSARPENDWNWLDSTGDPPPPDPSAIPCVVVIAMNLETAADPVITFDSLRELADRLARVVARAELQGVEIAVTLPVKQSADKALQRLLDHAPSSAHAGRIERVHLLSRDRGLAESIAGELGPTQYLAVSPDADWLFTWKLCSKKGRPRRAAKDPSRNVVSLRPPAEEEVHAIDTPALATWAAERPIQIPAGSSFADVVEEIRRRPGLLTQAGLTLTSARGIARMDAVSHGVHPMLGPCGHDDGLELCGHAVEVRSYEVPKNSSLGSGAVRFQRPPCTIQTSLPPGVVAAVEGAIEVGDRRVVATEPALLAVTPARLASSASFRVNLRTGGDSGAPALVAVVTSDFGVPLPAWWLRCNRDSDKAWSDLRIRGLHVLLDGPVTNIRGQSALEIDELGLIVRAPHVGRVEVHLPAGLTGGKLGVGLVDKDRVAVLGRYGRAHPAGLLECQAIQEVSTADLRAAYPDLRSNFRELRRLPLMVPR